MDRKRAATELESSCEHQDKIADKRRRQNGQFGESGVLDFCIGQQSSITLPLWTELKAVEPPSQSASVAAASLQLWCKQGSAQNSVSFRCPGSDDEDTEDTATSSCSSDSSAHAAAGPATATATEDEGDSLQLSPKALAAAAFSGFGQRACVTPDLSGFEQWDIIETLLALGQS